MAAELARQSVEYEFIRVPGGPHVFDARMDDPEVRKIFESALAFLKRRR
jgi:dipeptidyl aminopeptidase/acylaminoacyl peptidase